MSSLFEDKVFNEMDEMSQMIEPIKDPLNDILSSFPSEIHISNTDILNCISNSYQPYLHNNFSICIKNYILRDLMINNEYFKANKDDVHLTDAYSNISDMFDLEFENGDLKKINMSDILSDDGTRIKLIKRCSVIPMTTFSVRLYAKWYINIGNMKKVNQLNNLKDIISMINSEYFKASQSRSFSTQFDILCTAMEKIFNDDIWKIRNLELAGNIGKWMKSYIKCRDSVAMTNLLKLKLMVSRNNGSGLYSI